MLDEFRQMTQEEFEEYKQGRRDYLSHMADKREKTLKNLKKWKKSDEKLLERLPVRISSRGRSIEKVNKEFIEYCLKIDAIDELKIEQCRTRRALKNG